MEGLIDILSGFGSSRIVLVGDFMLDEYIYGDVERISPEAPVPVLRVERREFRSGGAGNAAGMMAAIGADVTCVGITGKDRHGEILIDQLQQKGIDTSGLVAVDDRPTTVKTRCVGMSQHKNPHQILRVDEENISPLSEQSREKLLSKVAHSLADSSGGVLLSIQDHDKGLLCGDMGQRIIQIALDNNCEVVVDPARISDYSRYRGASVLTPNRFEASMASGVEIGDDESLILAASTLSGVADGADIVITLDREGSFLYKHDGQNQQIPTRTRGVYDGTGAGDAVMAMISVAVCHGCDLSSGVALANIAGGLEVERFGVVPVLLDEIVEELQCITGAGRSKIPGQTSLISEIQKRKRDRQRVVFTNGCFDLMHAGHVTYLKEARQEGNCLIVAINSDASARRLKGPGRPVIPEGERAMMLAALECVDYVTIFDEDTPEKLLELLRPDLLVKGGTTPCIVGRELVEAYGGEVKNIGLVEGLSTTGIINRIMENLDE